MGEGLLPPVELAWRGSVVSSGVSMGRVCWVAGGPKPPVLYRPTSCLKALRHRSSYDSFLSRNNIHVCFMLGSYLCKSLFHPVSNSTADRKSVILRTAHTYGQSIITKSQKIKNDHEL